MFRKKILFITIVSLLTTSCAGTWDSVKRGITGSKQNSVDEFLVQKKDPLILPPDYENLPTPNEQKEAKEEMLSVQKTLNDISADEEFTSTGRSTEDSILKQINKN